MGPHYQAHLSLFQETLGPGTEEPDKSIPLSKTATTMPIPLWSYLLLFSP